MRHPDFSPLFRSTVGFDRLVQLLDAATSFDNDSGYPPYNIESTGENQYRITVAVAGFEQDEINVEAKESLLTIRGEKKPDDAERTYLHRGIAARSFERRFQLADYVEVDSADLKDGMLSVDLKRNLPERMKPRSIPISDGATPKRIEAAA